MDKQKQSLASKINIRQNQTQAERLSTIQLKANEESRMKVIFNDLCGLQEEKSSDEDSKEKIYKKKIEERANIKKMKIAKNEFISKTSFLEKKATQKKVYSEDEEISPPKDKEDKKRKFGVKALRKTMRSLCDEYIKEELTQMIWEVDEDLDGFIGEGEFINMYKRAISDEKEEEPKKLFYLIEFLMFDKESKHYITIEDTLEILCVRNPSKIDAAIDNIFNIEASSNQKGSKKKRETMTYIEYSDRMHELSMSRRTVLNNRKKIFCDKIKEEVIKQKN